MSRGRSGTADRGEAETTPSPPQAEDVLPELDRILASGDFDASPRSRAFVRFIVEETLLGREEGLSQAAIATHVFGRRDDFDPTVDPIVRIQAGRLRRSLERYYLIAGARDRVRIELPRGGYVPVLRWASPAKDAADETDPMPEETPSGWPSILLSLRPEGDRDGETDARATRFMEHLAVELGRYRDVGVVLDQEPSRLSSSPRPVGSFALTVRVFENDGGLRVTVRLVDRRTALQVWAEEYRDLPRHDDPFLTETAQVVAARVASEYGIVAQTLWKKLRPDAAGETTYEAVLRSYEFFAFRDPAAFVPALEGLRRAVTAEPACALAWVQLARLHAANEAFEIAAAETSAEQGLAFAQNAVRLDPSSQRGRAMLAFALLVKDEVAAGLAEANRALDLEPATFVYLEMIGFLLSLLGDWDRGTALVRRAHARNPHHLPFGYLALWADHLRRGEVEESYEAALRYSDAAYFWRALMRACSLGHLGRLEEARVEVAELLRSKPGFASRGRTLIGRLIKPPDLRERIAHGLGKAGLRLD